jgi:hypothetical protein
MVNEGKKRLVVTLTEDMIGKLDLYAELMGVTKSQLVSVWVGQQLLALETGMNVIRDIGKEVAARATDGEPG